MVRLVALAASIISISCHGFASAIGQQNRLRGGSSNNERYLNSNVQYYSIPSSGLCAIKDERTPSWITEFYTDYTECCSKGWVEAKCLAEAPPGAIASNSATTDDNSEYYYQVSTTGMCSPVDAYTPSYLTVADYFTSYRACCKKSWNEAACMAANVELTPTNSPSLKPTDVPSSSAGPSYQPSSSKVPSAEPSSSPSVSPSSLHLDHNATETSNETTIADATPFSSETNSSEPSDTTEVNGTDINATDVTNASSKEPAFSTTEPSETNSTQVESNETSTTTTTTTTTTTYIASNSSCVAALWHVSEDFQRCTNAFGYDPQWDADNLRDMYLHSSLHNCCAMFFYVHGKECIHEDICAVEVDEETYDPCTAKWHPNHVNQDGCSNSEDFPEEWLGNDSLFFGSAGDCCDSMFGARDCVVYDECEDREVSTTEPPLHTDPPEPSTHAPDASSTEPPCQSAKWHLSEDFRMCTNSLSYPEFWNTPVLAPIYLLSTVEECCINFFGGDCIDIEDVCAPLCESAKWHPSPDSKSCTNARDHYPLIWDSEDLAPVYLHSTAISCCDKFFGGNMELCSPHDVCAISTTTSSVAPDTTAGGAETTAETSSTKISQSATELSSSESSVSEFDCKSSRWHPDPINSDGCSNSLTYPPEWEHAHGLWFDDAESCCEFFSTPDQPCKVYKMCEEEELPTVTTSTPQPSTTTAEEPKDCISNTWYPDMINKDGCSNSLDVDESLRGNPHFSFSSSEECCNTILRYKECKIYQVCEEGDSTTTSTTPQVLSCKSSKWHPDLIHADGCSNSIDNIGEDWDSKFFLNSPEACCAQFFSDGECVVHKDCDDQAETGAELAEPPCQSTKWHPDMIYRNGCSNSLDNVPEEWDERYFLDSPEACCNLFFKDENCIVHRDCDDQIEASVSSTQEA